MTDAALAVELGLAGLHFIERLRGEVSLPLPPARSAASCLPEHGRFDSRPDEVVDIEDPDMPAVVNAGRWRMATEYGLFDQRREFLLDVDYAGHGEPGVDPEHAWVRVRLDDSWDLADSGAPVLWSETGALLTDGFVPEFTMLSMDGKVLLNTIVWSNETISTIVIRPDRLRNAVE